MIFANEDSGKYQCPMALNTDVGMPCVGEECAAWRQRGVTKSHKGKKGMTGVGYCGMAGYIKVSFLRTAT